MTTHALSDNWLTDDLSWDEGKKFDAPFLAGVPVRVLECTPIPWDEKPRFMQKIWINEKMSVVITVRHSDHDVLTCSDHNGECICKKIARAWMGV